MNSLLVDILEQLKFVFEPGTDAPEMHQIPVVAVEPSILDVIYKEFEVWGKPGRLYGT